VDEQLRETEVLLNSPEKIERVHAGVIRYAERLRAQGVTAIFVAPMQKQYFGGRLPLFAPRIAEASHFMALYERLKRDSRIQFIDVYAILKALHAQGQPIFYRQDFHWTPIGAHAVGKAIVDRIAALEGSSLRWDRPVELVHVPFQGSEARFAARLNATERIVEPILVHNWLDVHQLTAREPAKAGVEFVSERLDDPDALPATCLYGNSFGDEIVGAGFPDFFASFTRVDRASGLPEVPGLIRGRCAYLIVQILDIQAIDWESLAP
jgi:alginate O-acetyltransferase complex protein AlgJ